MSLVDYNLVFVLHCITCLFMSGIIWFVQIVHYPLMSHVGENAFAKYEQRHRILTFYIVAPAMLIESITGAILFLIFPWGDAATIFSANISLLAVALLSTFLLQAPLHRRLSSGFEPQMYDRLIRTNWIRTVSWTVRALMLGFVVWSLIRQPNNIVKQELGFMPSFEVGDLAPDFSAVTSDGKRIALSDFRGRRPVVLFFYPKDGTAVCTKEVCAFRDSYDKCLAEGVEVIGVSGDTDESHQKFARDHHLPYPIVSDTEGVLRSLFRVPRSWGIIPGRVTFIIDKEGVIQMLFSAQLASDEHVRRALVSLKIAH